MENKQAIIDVLKENARAIFHMRRQMQRNRFGLIFGAGISVPWGVPNWNGLNIAVAKDPDVDCVDLCKLQCSETLRTQRLFEHYKSKCYATESVGIHHTVKLNRRIQREWRDIIHRNLYRNCPKTEDPKAIEDMHPYIKSYVAIMRGIPLTVNYNFDDFIERILSFHREDSENKHTRGFEVAWDIRFPFRSEKRVIFHPNGYLPFNLTEASKKVILSEDEFAEQLFGTLTGQNASLIHHMSKNTCLLIGLSLEDVTLKHILRQATKANPGQYHYYVHYLDNEEIDDSKQKAIKAANFDTYNLITLFLHNDEISALGDLLGQGFNLDEPVKRDLEVLKLAKENDIYVSYVYYIVGAVCAGKSTVAMHFRNLIAYDEWFEPRLLKLSEDWRELTPPDSEEIDKWLMDQFSKKNHKLSSDGPGLFIIDRCPLDPISFTERDHWPGKAKMIFESVTPGKEQRIFEGHIILLVEDTEELEIRAIEAGKKYGKEELHSMQEELKLIYSMDGVTVIDVSRMSITEIIKRIALIIHFESYKPADIQQRLNEIMEGNIQWNHSKQ